MLSQLISYNCVPICGPAVFVMGVNVKCLHSNDWIIQVHYGLITLHLSKGWAFLFLIYAKERTLSILTRLPLHCTDGTGLNQHSFAKTKASMLRLRQQMCRRLNRDVGPSNIGSNDLTLRMKWRILPNPSSVVLIIFVSKGAQYGWNDYLSILSLCRISLPFSARNYSWVQFRLF